MKPCTKCKAEKSESEFYQARHTSDGLHSWCKECVKQLSKNTDGNSSFRRPRAKSSDIAKTHLRANGIPVCTGTSMGVPYVDLMAWACVPIEAKMAKQSHPNRFTWTFTPGQFRKLEGFIIFIADFDDYKRILVIPAGHEMFDDKKTDGGSKSFSVTFESKDLRSRWDDVAQYEDAYWQIENARQNWK